MKDEIIPLNMPFSLETSDKEMNRMKLAVQREGGVVIKNVMVSTIHEQGRALLAKTALENIGALSALENQLFKIAPLGQERYKMILDAYALGAAQKIMRW
jgi:hypothetical protein